MILLDTHALIWLDSGSSKLGPKTRSLLDEAQLAGELAVSAISFWEVAMLIERKRIDLDIPPLMWRQDLMNSGLSEIAVTGEIGILAATLESFHGDPADRLITATALVQPSRLVTSDHKILGWKGGLQLQDARL